MFTNYQVNKPSFIVDEQEASAMEAEVVKPAMYDDVELVFNDKF